MKDGSEKAKKAAGHMLQNNANLNTKINIRGREKSRGNVIVTTVYDIMVENNTSCNLLLFKAILIVKYLNYFRCCKSFMKMDKVDRVNKEEDEIYLIVTMTMAMTNCDYGYDYDYDYE